MEEGGLRADDDLVNLVLIAVVAAESQVGEQALVAPSAAGQTKPRYAEDMRLTNSYLVRAGSWQGLTDWCHRSLSHMGRKGIHGKAGVLP